MGSRIVVATFTPWLCALTACSVGSSVAGGTTGAGAPQAATTLSLGAAPATVTAGESVALTATVSPAAATGEVTFLDGGAALGSATLSSGTATLETSALAAGVHAITAVYGGSSTHAGSASSAVSVSVTSSGAAATTTSLQASPASVTSGESVTLTATVSPAAATGQVTFLDGSATLGSAALASGTATLATSALAAGVHAITAVYGGSSTHAGSAASAVAVTVTSAGGGTAISTTLKVMKFSAGGTDWATSASVPLEGKVVLAATMSDANATGTVSFRDGGTVLGATPLSGGRAVFITSALAAGTHSVTAVYSGSSTFAASASSAVSVTVAGSKVDCAAITGTTSFGFFVASYDALTKLSGSTSGFGGNLRFPDRTDTSDDAGLKGADTLCAVIADMVEEGSSSCKTWRAFLSTAGTAVSGVNSTAVSARDRVGNGPWYDIKGRKLAGSPSDFPYERPQGCNSEICNDFPNEAGVLNHRPDGVTTVDNHDMLTGSNGSGTLYSRTATCFDWTSDGYTSGYRPRCGHSWPTANMTGGVESMRAWISAFTEGGCRPGVNLTNENNPGGTLGQSVGASGGYGGFYCFVVK